MRAAAATKAHTVCPLEDCEAVVERRDERPVAVILSSSNPAMSCGWGGHASITRASAGENRALMAPVCKACPFPSRHLHFSIILTTTFPGGMDRRWKVPINTGEGPQMFAKKKPSALYLAGPAENYRGYPDKKREGVKIP